MIGDKLFNCHSRTTSVKEQTYRSARLWLLRLTLLTNNVVNSFNVVGYLKLGEPS